MKSIAVACCLVALMPFTAVAQEEDKHCNVGLRLNIMAADGEPANDMIGGGLFGRTALNETWDIGLAFDWAQFDYEEPYLIVGLNNAPGTAVVDATVDSYRLSAWAEREFDVDMDLFQPFVMAGLGVALVEVEDVTGPEAGGGTYDISTDVDYEIVPQIGAGFRSALFGNLALELGLRADYHITEWDSKDRNSRRSGTVDSYLALGGYVGAVVEF